MGRLLIKAGVDFGTVFAPAGARLLEAIKQVAQDMTFDVVITSAADGAHSGPADPHHTGEAFDLRTHHLQEAQKRLLLASLRTCLYRKPRRFYVVLEAAGAVNEHIHCQKRKGTTYTILDYLDDL